MGVILILITLLGYVSNWLNWKFLNYKATYLLYYIGTFIHESSHAILCVMTGAKIEKFQVFSRQPQVVHLKSKIPLIGEFLISIAPIAGGLLFLFLLNRYILGNYFTVPTISSWQTMILEPLGILGELNPLQWQSWLMVILFFNVGAMIGPSWKDLKNIWPFFIILIFITYSPLINIGLLVISFILINILLQIITGLVLAIVHRCANIL